MFDEAEAPLGAVLLIGPIERMRANQAAFADLVRQAGAEVSRRLGSKRGDAAYSAATASCGLA